MVLLLDLKVILLLKEEYMSCELGYEMASGNIFIRPINLKTTGDIVEGHVHNFDHTTIFISGWWLIEARTPDGRNFTRQFASPCYLKNNTKARVVKYKNSYIKLNDHDLLLPDAEEVKFEANFSHALIKKEVNHKLIVLDIEGNSAIAWCVYSHRTAQGHVIQECDGWEEAYR
jgi:hypothetical protein